MNNNIIYTLKHWTKKGEVKYCIRKEGTITFENFIVNLNTWVTG